MLDKTKSDLVAAAHGSTAGESLLSAMLWASMTTTDPVMEDEAAEAM